MKRFGSIEVGSTTTKGALIENGKITYFPLVSIEFKSNFKTWNKILNEDKLKLFDYIAKIKANCDSVYVCGTSFFRSLNEAQQAEFCSDFKIATGIDFNIVSADQENDFTVNGVISNIDYKGKLAVMIGGGGSTELAIINKGKIIEKINYGYGATDITNKFPDLKNDKATSSYNSMMKQAKQMFPASKNKADVLVLAGGDYITFYEFAGFPLQRNMLYNSPDQPYILDIETSTKFDHIFLYETSLDKLKEKHPDYALWFNGTRGMRICVNTVLANIKAKHTIPTRISMLMGILFKMEKGEI